MCIVDVVAGYIFVGLRDCREDFLLPSASLFSSELGLLIGFW